MQWETRFSQLQRFKEKYGHAQVPIGWAENVQLANWVSKQRQEYKNLLRGRTTRLDENRIRLLNRVGFAWQLQRGGRRRQLKAKSAGYAKDHHSNGSDGESATGSDKEVPDDQEGPCILPGEVLIGQGASKPMSPIATSTGAPDMSLLTGQTKTVQASPTHHSGISQFGTTSIMAQGPTPSPSVPPLRQPLLLQQPFGQQQLPYLTPSSTNTSSMPMNRSALGLQYLSAAGGANHQTTVVTAAAPGNDLLDLMRARNTLLQNLQRPQTSAMTSLQMLGATGTGGGAASAFSIMRGLHGSSTAAAAASQNTQSQFHSAAAAQRSALLPMLRPQSNLFFPLGFAATAPGNSPFAAAQTTVDSTGMSSLLDVQRLGMGVSAGFLGVSPTGAVGGLSWSDESNIPRSSRAADEQQQQRQRQYLQGLFGFPSSPGNAGGGQAPSGEGGAHGSGMQGGSST
jgi:Helicase associated domain